MEYRIPEGNLEELKSRIAGLAKRAGKLGVPAPTLEVLGHEDVEGIDWERTVDPSFPFKVVERFYRVEVAGEAPKFAGWELAGVLQQEEAGVVVRGVPGIELPARFREEDPARCDHCGLRRYRKNTFVVRREDEYKQVGSDCIKDFLGHADPEALAAFLEHWGRLAEEAGEYGGGGWTSRAHPSLETVLAYAAGAVRQFGYVSRTAAQDRPELIPTSSRVGDNLDPFRSQKLEPRDRIAPDAELAGKAADWYRTVLAERAESDFDHNLKVLLAGTQAAPKNWGYLCYVPAGYLRHLEREAEREARRRQEAAGFQGSRHVGKVGERLELDVTVLSVRAFDGSQWGTSYLTKLLDVEGNLLIWWASKEIEEGRAVRVKATVKRHEVRGGVQQTVISRPTLVPTAEQKAAVKDAKAAVKAAEQELARVNAAYDAGYKAYWERYPDWTAKEADREGSQALWDAQVAPWHTAVQEARSALDEATRELWDATPTF